MEKRLNESRIIPVAIALIITMIALVMVIVVKGADAAGGNVSITEANAKSIALQDAGEKETDVTFTKSALEKEDGKMVYEIDFYTDTQEYDYEILADTGTVYAKDVEKIRKSTSYQQVQQGQSQQPAQSSNVDSSKYIGAEKAKSKALAAAGVSAGNARFTKAKLDYDDGRMTYEIEFYSGSYEYDYEIDATNGNVISSDIERHYTSNSGSSSKSSTNNSSNNKVHYYDDDDYDDDDDWDDD